MSRRNRDPLCPLDWMMLLLAIGFITLCVVMIIHEVKA